MNNSSATITRALNALLEQTLIAQRIASRGRSAYDDDELIRLAVEAVLIHVGQWVERIDQIDSAFTATHPELELRAAKATRNHIAHDYEIIDDDIIWDILTIKMPQLAAGIRALLST
ncbi:MAG: DUF86 domain-containing protein [Propionibacteriaceae bacterium]|nr:DUF86 domain-containing protein [Propionibacteriaceae bacterium]